MLESVGKISQYLGLPINSSSHGHMIDIMMGWVHWLMLVLFVGWGIYLIITVFKFRSSSNPKADYNGVQSHYSQYAEYGVIIFEAFLLIGLSIPLYSQFKTALPDDNNLHHVRVIAQQFAWNIHYPGEDGVFGNTARGQQTSPLGVGDALSPIVSEPRPTTPCGQHNLFRYSDLCKI